MRPKPDEHADPHDSSSDSIDEARATEDRSRSPSSSGKRARRGTARAPPRCCAGGRPSRGSCRTSGGPESLLLRALARLPGDPEMLRELAAVREQAGDLAGVAAVLEEEADRTSRPAEAAQRYLALARWWEERIGRRDRAALFYGRAFRLDPGPGRGATPGRGRAPRRSAGTATRRSSSTAGATPAATGPSSRWPTPTWAWASCDEPLEHGLALDATVEAMLLDRGAPGAAETLERLRSAPRTWRDQAAALEQRAAVERDRKEAARIWLRLAALHVAYDPDGASMAREAFDRAWLASPGHPRALDLLERWHGERGDWPPCARS